jgi:excisionase family DNA binding protein
MHRDKPQPTATTIQEPDAAQYVGLSRAYLRQARAQGRGPAFVRLGRAVRYLTADLDAWLEAHRVEPKPKGR